MSLICKQEIVNVSCDRWLEHAWEEGEGGRRGRRNSKEAQLGIGMPSSCARLSNTDQLTLAPTNHRNDYSSTPSPFPPHSQ